MFESIIISLKTLKKSLSDSERKKYKRKHKTKSKKISIILNSSLKIQKK